MYMYRYMYMLYVYVYAYVYVYVYVYVCVCMYVCVWSVSGKDGERTVSRAKSEETLLELQEKLTRKSFVILVFMGAKDKSNHLTAGSLQRFP